MRATGLDVFDKTLQTTHIWLNDITEVIGPDKQVAWHVLGAVLRTLRDRVPLQVAAHLGAELPLLVRGLYYVRARWSPFCTRHKLDGGGRRPNLAPKTWMRYKQPCWPP